jgi:hypothetical protein
MLMTNEKWKDIKHFTKSENWGDWTCVEYGLIKSLDEFRKSYGMAIHISPVKNAVYAESVGHSSKSLHYPVLGDRGNIIIGSRAADVFPTGNLLEAWMLAIRMYMFNGLGCYPYWEWNRKNVLLRGGLHLDTRTMQDGQKSLWWQDKSGAYRYLRTISDIKEFMVVMISMFG